MNETIDGLAIRIVQLIQEKQQLELQLKLILEQQQSETQDDTD